jgi:hypothetical protein
MIDVVPVSGLFLSLFAVKQSASMAFLFVIAETPKKAPVFCNISKVFHLNSRALYAP